MAWQRTTPKAQSITLHVAERRAVTDGRSFVGAGSDVIVSKRQLKALRATLARALKVNDQATVASCVALALAMERA